MNPMVADWAKGDMTKVNIDPDVRDVVFKSYQNPKSAEVA
jgi:hypothetical protein